MGELRIGLILGSTREGRMCDRVAKFVRKAVEKEHTVAIYDPLDLTLTKNQPSMAWLQDPSLVPGSVRALTDSVAQCDALVAITAEYWWSVPPALANIVDNVLPTTCTWKPCTVVSYSVESVGGWRSAMQVRQMMGASGCLMTQKQMGIPHVHQSLDAEGIPRDERLERELNVTLGQLYWLARAINSYKTVEKAPAFSL